MSTWHGSQHGYGLLSPEDVAFLESIVTTIAEQSGSVKVLEIGVANAYTARGLYEFCRKRSLAFSYDGVDMENGAPHQGVMPPGGRFHCGLSEEIFHSIAGPFNLLFIDGCHCSNHCILDFCNYSGYVVPGGFCCFHDTNPSPDWCGVHDKPGFWQGHGPKVAAFCIAPREAIKKLGLADGNRTDWSFYGEQATGKSQGMMAFRKTK